MASSTTLNSVVNREDLTNILEMAHPLEMPGYSMLPKTKATGMYHEWAMDDHKNPVYPGVNEGADVSSFENKENKIARWGNRIQKFEETWKVSEEQMAVDTAGVDNNKAYAEAKCLVDLKRGIESAIFSDQDLSSSDPQKTRGLGDMIDTAGPSDLDSNYYAASGQIDTTDPAGGSFFEDNLNSMMQTLYENGGMPDGGLYLFAGPTLKREISQFGRSNQETTSVARTQLDGKSKEIMLVVDRYVGDFGAIDIIPSVYLKRESNTGIDATSRKRGYLFRKSTLQIAQLKAPYAKDLSVDNQPNPRGYAHALLTLVCKNTKQVGKFAAAS